MKKNKDPDQPKKTNMLSALGLEDTKRLAGVRSRGNLSGRATAPARESTFEAIDDNGNAKRDIQHVSAAHVHRSGNSPSITGPSASPATPALTPALTPSNSLTPVPSLTPSPALTPATSNTHLRPSPASSLLPPTSRTPSPLYSSHIRDAHRVPLCEPPNGDQTLPRRMMAHQAPTTELDKLPDHWMLNTYTGPKQAPAEATEAEAPVPPPAPARRRNVLGLTISRGERESGGESGGGDKNGINGTFGKSGASATASSITAANAPISPTTVGRPSSPPLRLSIPKVIRGRLSRGSLRSPRTAPALEAFPSADGVEVLVDDSSIAIRRRRFLSEGLQLLGSKRREEREERRRAERAAAQFPADFDDSNELRNPEYDRQRAENIALARRRSGSTKSAHSGKSKSGSGKLSFWARDHGERDSRPATPHTPRPPTPKTPPTSPLPDWRTTDEVDIRRRFQLRWLNQREREERDREEHEREYERQRRREGRETKLLLEADMQEPPPNEREVRQRVDTEAARYAQAKREREREREAQRERNLQRTRDPTPAPANDGDSESDHDASERCHPDPAVRAARRERINVERRERLQMEEQARAREEIQLAATEAEDAAAAAALHERLEMEARRERRTHNVHLAINISAEVGYAERQSRQATTPGAQIASLTTRASFATLTPTAITPTQSSFRSVGRARTPNHVHFNEVTGDQEAAAQRAQSERQAHTYRPPPPPPETTEHSADGTITAPTVKRPSALPPRDPIPAMWRPSAESEPARPALHPPHPPHPPHPLHAPLPTDFPALNREQAQLQAEVRTLSEEYWHAVARKTALERGMASGMDASGDLARLQTIENLIATRSAQSAWRVARLGLLDKCRREMLAAAGIVFNDPNASTLASERVRPESTPRTQDPASDRRNIRASNPFEFDSPPARPVPPVAPAAAANGKPRNILKSLRGHASALFRREAQHTPLPTHSVYASSTVRTSLHGSMPNLPAGDGSAFAHVDNDVQLPFQLELAEVAEPVDLEGSEESAMAPAEEPTTQEPAPAPASTPGRFSRLARRHRSATNIRQTADMAADSAGHREASIGTEESGLSDPSSATAGTTGRLSRLRRLNHSMLNIRDTAGSQSRQSSIAARFSRIYKPKPAVGAQVYPSMADLQASVDAYAKSTTNVAEGSRRPSKATANAAPGERGPSVQTTNEASIAQARPPSESTQLSSVQPAPPVQSAVQPAVQPPVQPAQPEVPPALQSAVHPEPVEFYPPPFAPRPDPDVPTSADTSLNLSELGRAHDASFAADGSVIHSAPRTPQRTAAVNLLDTTNASFAVHADALPPLTPERPTHVNATSPPEDLSAGADPHAGELDEQDSLADMSLDSIASISAFRLGVDIPNGSFSADGNIILNDLSAPPSPASLDARGSVYVSARTSVVSDIAMPGAYPRHGAVGGNAGRG